MLNSPVAGRARRWWSPADECNPGLGDFTGGFLGRWNRDGNSQEWKVTGEIKSFLGTKWNTHTYIYIYTYIYIHTYKIFIDIQIIYIYIHIWISSENIRRRKEAFSCRAQFACRKIVHYGSHGTVPGWFGSNSIPLQSLRVEEAGSWATGPGWLSHWTSGWSAQFPLSSWDGEAKLQVKQYNQWWLNQWCHSVTQIDFREDPRAKRRTLSKTMARMAQILLSGCLQRSEPCSKGSRIKAQKITEWYFQTTNLVYVYTLPKCVLFFLRSTFQT